MSDEQNNTWLYHRGQWQEIDEPVEWSKRQPEVTFDDFLGEFGYHRYPWGLENPHEEDSAQQKETALSLDVFQWASQTGERLPRYLILVELYDHEEAFYAEDLPDVIQLLALFAPIATAQINTWAIFVELKELRQAFKDLSKGQLITEEGA
jgi:hypothetical protein